MSLLNYEYIMLNIAGEKVSLLLEEVVAPSVLIALKGLQRAAVAAVAVGAHEPLAADAIALVLASAQVSRTFGALLHPTHIHLPAVAAVVGVEVAAPPACEPCFAAHPGECQRRPRQQWQCQCQHEERPDGGP